MVSLGLCSLRPALKEGEFAEQTEVWVPVGGTARAFSAEPAASAEDEAVGPLGSPGPHPARSQNGVRGTQQSLTTVVLTPGGRSCGLLPDLQSGPPGRAHSPFPIQSRPVTSPGPLGASLVCQGLAVALGSLEEGPRLGKAHSLGSVQAGTVGLGPGETFSLTRKAQGSQRFPSHVHGSLEAKGRGKNVRCRHQARTRTPGLPPGPASLNWNGLCLLTVPILLCGARASPLTLSRAG